MSALILLASVLVFNAAPSATTEQVASSDYVGTAKDVFASLRREGLLSPTDSLARSLDDRPILLSMSTSAKPAASKIFATILHARWRETKDGTILEPSAFTPDARAQDASLEAKSILMPGEAGAPSSLDRVLASFTKTLGPQGLVSLGLGSTVTYSTSPTGPERPFPSALDAEVTRYQERIREVQGMMPELYVTCTRTWSLVGLRATSLTPAKGVVETANMGLRIEVPSPSLPPNLAGETEVSEDIKGLCRFILDRQVESRSGRLQAERLVSKLYDSSEPLLVLAKPLLKRPADAAWFGIAPSDRWLSGLAEALLVGGSDIPTIWSKLKGGVVFESVDGGFLARPRLHREFAEPILDRTILRDWLKTCAAQRREDVIGLAKTFYQAKDAPLGALSLLRKFSSPSTILVRSEGLLTALALAGSLTDEQMAAAESEAGAKLSTQVKGQIGLFRNLTEEAWGEFTPEENVLAPRTSGLSEASLLSQSRLWLKLKAEPGFSLDGGGAVLEPLTYDELVAHLAERCRAGSLAPDASMMALHASNGTTRTTTLSVSYGGAAAQFKLGVEPDIPTRMRPFSDIPELKNLIRDVKKALGKD